MIVLVFLLPSGTFESEAEGKVDCGMFAQVELNTSALSLVRKRKHYLNIMLLKKIFFEDKYFSHLKIQLQYIKLYNLPIVVGIAKQDLLVLVSQSEARMQI